MNNVKELERYVAALGWFSRTVKLTISLENEFEGFYGRASENWEKRVTIELESPDEAKCPNIKVVGKRYEDMDKVASYVMKEVNDWKVKIQTKGDQ